MGNQEKRPTLEVAEILEIDPREVKKLLKELRKAEPALFPFEREYLEFGKQGIYNEGHKLLSINDIDEDEIRKKL